MLESFVLRYGVTGCYGTTIVVEVVSVVSRISIENVHFSASDDDVDSLSPYGSSSRSGHPYCVGGSSHFVRIWLLLVTSMAWMA